MDQKEQSELTTMDMLSLPVKKRQSATLLEFDECRSAMISFQLEQTSKALTDVTNVNPTTSNDHDSDRDKSDSEEKKHITMTASVHVDYQKPFTNNQKVLYKCMQLLYEARMCNISNRLLLEQELSDPNSFCLLVDEAYNICRSAYLVETKVVCPPAGGTTDGYKSLLIQSTMKIYNHIPSLSRFVWPHCYRESFLQACQYVGSFASS